LEYYGSGTLINYSSDSGSDFLTSYGSGSSSKRRKVTVIAESKAEYLALGFGVDTDQLEIVPHLLQQGVVVPLVMGRDGHRVGDLADYVYTTNIVLHTI
jgi:hypothetical protein